MMTLRIPHSLRDCFLAFCICLLPVHAFSEAPVVDDSENFAMLDEQQVAIQQPVAKAQLSNADRDEELPLVRDNETGDNEEGGTLLKIQSLQQEIRELRGQLEVQTHHLKLLQQQQLAFYKDIDVRLSNNAASRTAQAAPPAALNIGPSVASGTTVAVVEPNTSSRSNPADEQISYLAAYDLLKNKHYDEALNAMQTFAVRYPQGGYTANAQYWLGELFMVKENYAQAINHFETVLKQFPGSSKAAASTLKIGYALAASGKGSEARQRLNQVLKNYPDTPTAQLAAIKLESLHTS